MHKDWALYLPAISNAYTTTINNNNISNARLPKGMNSVADLNFFKPGGLFEYKYGLYSAGHAQLNLSRAPAGTDMVRDRPDDVFLLGDSGGFQIGTGKWKADWTNPKCPKALKYRQDAFNWLSGIADYSMSLDIPAWTYTHPSGSENANIHSYQDSKIATVINHEYFLSHSDKDSRFLNVLQGTTHDEALDWYDTMKHFSDKNKFEYPYRGWAFGGVVMGDIHMTLKMLCYLINDDLLKQGENDWIHILGTSKIIWGLMLTDIQKVLRKYVNPDISISYDSASPFLSIVNGQIYTGHDGLALTTASCIDDKSLTNDTRFLKDAMDDFTDTPVSKILHVNDICVYTKTCKNKINKIGKTSWDTFSYVLIMGHNTKAMITALENSNKAYEHTNVKMLENQFTGVTFRDILEEVFSITDLQKQLEILDYYSKFFTTITGNRNSGGKNSFTATTQFNNLFGEI